MDHLKVLNKYFFKYRYRLLLGILFISVSNIFAVLPAAVIGNAFDLVAESIGFFQNYEGFSLQGKIFSNLGLALFLFALTVFLLAVAKGIFVFFSRQTIIVMSRLIEFDMRNDIYNHYQSLDIAFYKRNQTGDLMSRITEDVSRVRMYLGPALMYSINLIVLVVMVISVMLQVNAELTLYVLIPLPILSVTIYYVNNLIHKRSEAIQKQLAFLTSIAQEVYSGIRLIKSFVQEIAVQRFFGKKAEEYKEKALQLASVEAFFFPIMILLIGLSTILTIFIGGIAVINGKITPGNVAEFVIYVNMLTWPVTAIGWVASLLQRAAASQKRINEFLEIKPQITSPGRSNDINYNGIVEFKDVGFTYPDTGIEALRNISFKVGKGEKLAIIGKVGSGKSTIAQLLLRMYDASSGTISIGGADIKQAPLMNHRKKIGYVPQDTFLFSDSVVNNISFGTENVDHELIVQTAKDAVINDDILDLPQQYETLLGERGVNISGGQKQRISIARALIKDPEIIVLDDCLSAVDTDTEKAILSKLDSIVNKKTAIIITHRIFTLKNLSQIVVLDEGEIVEMGSHKELVAIRGHYFNLYESQKMEANNLVK